MLSIRPVELIVGVLGLAFIWFILATVREEDRLNARGETMFRKSLDRRGVLARTDAALRAAVAGLLGDAPGVLKRLREATHRGDALPDGGARRCYDVAVCALEGGGEWVRREVARRLRRAREEFRKEMR